jgi:hypothetical protein
MELSNDAGGGEFAGIDRIWAQPKGTFKPAGGRISASFLMQMNHKSAMAVAGHERRAVQ